MDNFAHDRIKLLLQFLAKQPQILFDSGVDFRVEHHATAHQTIEQEFYNLDLVQDGHDFFGHLENAVDLFLTVRVLQFPLLVFGLLLFIEFEFSEKALEGLFLFLAFSLALDFGVLIFGFGRTRFGR